MGQDTFFFFDYSARSYRAAMEVAQDICQFLKLYVLFQAQVTLSAGFRPLQLLDWEHRFLAGCQLRVAVSSFLEASFIHYSPCRCPPLAPHNISAYFSQDSKNYSLFNLRVLGTMTKSQKWPLIVFAVFCWLEKSRGRGLCETAVIGVS